MHVADLMHSGDAVPRVAGDTRVPEMLREMTDLRGLAASEVMHPGPKLIRGHLAGVLNSNDLMRAKVI